MTTQHDKPSRWWQYGLRDVLQWMLISALALGWYLDHRKLIREATLVRLAKKMAEDDVASLRGVIGSVQNVLSDHNLEVIYGVRGNRSYWYEIRELSP